ncbi:hypothetical protein [Paenibacillus sp. J2TS4]|uniref:hypothetical protein n=1 Tax=Paenibacillus sp. J2TS4 TaxID=2807194 RepID=UPI001B1EE172|nr:hypothetical protein [Paenibacillus sp. J2TS4]GIP31687.1 hypothetical protein J2TS4_08970 [Paenibacillus sp. J2TS4]
MTELNSLAAPDVLKKRLLALAALDLILCPEQWLRYHSFDPQWAHNVSLAIIDNGSGDHLFILFTPEGTIMKGFDHESTLSPHANDEYKVWPGIYDDVPAPLLSWLDDEAIEQEEVTFCIWRETGDSVWRKGEVEVPDGEDDGTEFLLGTIFVTPENYVEWAEDYFDMPVPVETVEQIYSGTPITEAMIRSLNPERDVEEALRELETLFTTA